MAELGKGKLELEVEVVVRCARCGVIDGFVFDESDLAGGPRVTGEPRVTGDAVRDDAVLDAPRVWARAQVCR